MAMTAVKEKVRVEEPGEVTKRREEQIQGPPRREERFDIQGNLDHLFTFWRHSLKNSFYVAQMWEDYTRRMWDGMVDQSLAIQQEQLDLQQQWVKMYRDIFRSLREAGEEHIEMIASMWEK